MKKLFVLSFIFLLILTSCCREKHFISDDNYRVKVEEQFQKQKLLAVNRDAQLFSVFKKRLSRDEKEALKFLYAYMPLSDLADYDGDFFLANIRASLVARDSLSWVKNIPEQIFRHFVLPVRVNNENLDSARILFYRELKPRVEKLSMKDAVLEVNHWCDKKVTYRPTDARTSSPLNTVQTSYGRCGEESTFTVAALRSVGIPARQCYTPRWAHCDDNHAWVEVWVDGRWHYLGACEPEQQLDVAWFSAPARRAMMVSTNVYGDYNGPEEALYKNEYYTRINLLSNYAPVKTISVLALNNDGSVADSAEVEFCLYNYAEFFPLARKYADRHGMASLSTGLGDMMIWVNNKKNFGFAKITVEKTDTVVIRMNADAAKDAVFEFDLIPPVERPVAVAQDERMKEQNSLMLKNEDEIRNAYMKTFTDSVSSVRLADELHLNRDSTWKMINMSRGNWREIEKFMRSAPLNLRDWVLPMLYSVAEKDLHDVTAEVLLSHLKFSGPAYNTVQYPNKSDFVNYVLCPRISLENLKSYKPQISEGLKKDFGGQMPGVDSIKKWITKNITINAVANYYNVPLTPRGSFELRVTDKNSRDILFVAICRTFGIPARIENSTKKTQYLSNGTWVDVNFDKVEPLVTQKAKVKFINVSKDKNFVPVYYTHYTIAIFKDGKYRTLDYEGAPEVSKFPFTLDLDTGKYILVTGSRKADGSVLSAVRFFSLKKDQEMTLEIKLREASEITEVLGMLDLNRELVLLGSGGTRQLADVAAEKPCILIWIDPDKEPTKHVIGEINQLRDLFEKWGGGMVFLLSEKNVSSFDESKYHDLPKQKLFIMDQNYLLLTDLENALKRKLKADMPAIAVITPKGEIIFTSSGYRIGTGEQLAKIIQ